MKKLKNISVYRLTFLIFLLAYFKSNIIFIISFIFLLIKDRKELIIYLFLCLILFISIKINSLFIDIKIYNPIKQIVINRIDSFSKETASILKTILLSDYDYNNSYNLGFGISYYYLFKKLENKNHNFVLLFILIFSLFFGFRTKFIIYILDNLLSRFIDNKQLKNAFIILIISIVLPLYINNISLLIIIIIKLINIINLKINFKTILAIIQSLFFNQISLSIFLYNYLIYVKYTVFLCSILRLLFNKFDYIYLYIIKIYSFINDILDFGLRGKISIISIILFIIITKLLNLKSYIKQLVVILLILITPINNPFCIISFIDVGQGDAILIQDSLSKGNILIDTGSKFYYQRLKNYLYSKGIYKIDYLIVTHEDEDHSGNLENLKRDFYLKNIIKKGIDIRLNKIHLNNIYLGKYDNENDNSLVYYLNINYLSFLFTADISFIPEAKLADILNKQIDVLKVGHHGSKYSSSRYFISKILPKYSVISTNGKYDHPSKECLDILNSYLSNILITENEGNIEFYLLSIGNFIKTNKRLIHIQ